MTVAATVKELGILNTYSTLDRFKTRIGIALTNTDNDDTLIDILFSASRTVDEYTARWFFVQLATKYFTGTLQNKVLIDDLLVLTTLKTGSDSDGTFNNSALIENQDFVLKPFNLFPKTLVSEIFTDQVFDDAPQVRDVEIVGQWGYGDGKSAAPYRDSGVTVTVATADGETLTVSAEGTIKVGHTLLIGTEQVFVYSVTSDASNQLGVIRGVNGSTASTHSAVAANVYLYPAGVATGTLMVAARTYINRAANTGMKSERMGDYAYTRAALATGELLTDQERGQVDFFVKEGLL